MSAVIIGRDRWQAAWCARWNREWEQSQTDRAAETIAAMNAKHSRRQTLEELMGFDPDFPSAA